MTKTNITEEEKNRLREYAKSSPLILVRAKAGAVLMSSKGMLPADIGDIQDRSEYTVQDWLQSWNRHRLASLFSGHQDNTNAAKLTREQRAEIKRALALPPHEHGIPGSFWDVPKLKDYCGGEFWCHLRV